MPYSPEHKAETRQRIVTAARRLFNRKGFSEVSIDEIMEAVGLTRGGFYNHFASKDELYAEAISQTMACEKTDINGVTIDFGQPPETLARQIISVYLSDRHLQDVEGMCPLVALPSDTARGGKAVRQAYTQVLSAMIGLFEASQGAERDARKRALTMATLCIGGMVLARAVEDEDLAQEIRTGALSSAMRQGGFPEAVPAVAAE